MDTIAYEIGNKLYLNITNRCTNACTFCVRGKDTYEGYPLWLTREPTAPEVLAAAGDPSGYEEIVFCGYGEPTEALPVLLAAAEGLQRYGVPVRLNTNGQGNLSHQKDITPLLAHRFQRVSISLNAATPERYNEISRPQYENAFAGMLDFARRASLHVPEVILSVVDTLPPAELAAARELASSLHLPLRVRELIET